MNKQVIEKAVALACADRVNSEFWTIGRIAEAESEEDKYFPALSVEVEDILPLAGNGKYGSVILRMLIEGQVDNPEEFAASAHAARVEDLCGKLDANFLTAINTRAAGDFECLGFADRPPIYGIDGRVWVAAIKVVCGIVWIRAVPIIGDGGFPILGEDGLPILG